MAEIGPLCGHQRAAAIVAAMTRTRHSYSHGDLVVVLDCADLDRAAEFWTAALGYVRTGPAGPTYLSVYPPEGAGCEILLQRVSDEKRAKNRLHLDLRTRDLAAEVDRVLALGATLVTDQPIAESGWLWHVLADPDGNEFCVLQPPESYWDD
jgi:predicted enzyme related to lactoylglutathione lyase